MTPLNWLLVTNAIFTLVVVAIAFALALSRVRTWIAAAEIRANTELVKWLKEEQIQTASLRADLTFVDERFMKLEEQLRIFEERQRRLAKTERADLGHGD